MCPRLTLKRGDRHGHAVLPNSAFPKSGDRLKMLIFKDCINLIKITPPRAGAFRVLGFHLPPDSWKLCRG